VLAAAAERVARKELALLTRAARSSDDIVQLFDGHAAFVANVMAVPVEAAQAHVADTIERGRAWIVEGSVLESDVLAVQTSALMRLE